MFIFGFLHMISNLHIQIYQNLEKYIFYVQTFQISNLYVSLALYFTEYFLAGGVENFPGLILCNTLYFLLL